MGEELELILYEGQAEATLDSKKRVALPSDIRKVIHIRSPSNSLIYCVVAHKKAFRYLAIYDAAGFKEKFLEFDAALYSSYKPDDQSRILVKNWQVFWAELERRVMFAASPKGTHFELWNFDNYQKYRQDILPKEISE